MYPGKRGIPLLENSEEARRGDELAVGDDEHLQRLLVPVFLHERGSGPSFLLASI